MGWSAPGFPHARFADLCSLQLQLLQAVFCGSTTAFSPCFANKLDQDKWLKRKRDPRQRRPSCWVANEIEEMGVSRPDQRHAVGNVHEPQQPLPTICPVSLLSLVKVTLRGVGWFYKCY